MSIAADLANDLSTLLQKWRGRENEMIDWLSGTATGGPNGDGRYPLTTVGGVEYLIECPALLADMVNGPASEADAARTEALGAANDALSALEDTEAARDATQQATSVAENARDQAANSEANTRTLVKKHFPKDDHFRVPKKTLSLPSDDPQGVIRWDDNFLYINTTKGYRRVPLEII